MDLNRYKISEYVEALRQRGLLVSWDGENKDAVITGFTYDSRAVTPGTLFVVKGAGFKEEYLKSAISDGAAAYVSERRIGDGDGCILVSDIRSAMAFLAKMYYNSPADGLTTFGITGTKGKSTTACFLRQILDLYAERTGGTPCGCISSIETYDGAERFASQLTTPESAELWRHLHNIRASGMTNAVVEVSSQALKYHRVDGVDFSVACLINVGLDHISPIEHKDFNDYFSSKLKIFDSCRVACVNADDEHAAETLRYIGGRVPTVTFGSDPGDTVFCSGAEKRADGIHFTVKTDRGDAEMRLTMPGMFNVQNALAATAMAYAAGVPLDVIRDGLECARAEGRMQVYHSQDGNVTVIVDYAHNAMSFDALFDVVDAEYPGVRKVVIFGCVGGKAQNRREELGRLTSRRADHVIVSEKDCADEPFEKIAEEITVHIRAAGTPYDVIYDRKEALARALSPGICEGVERRVVIFAGRGSEVGQKRGHVNVDYPSDPEITLRALAAYDRSHSGARTTG